MLPKKHRLTRREDFATIFSKGEYASIYDGISIKYIKTGVADVRVGFPVGKNYSKKAVERNKARRILRAATYQYLKAIKPGFDIIVLIRPEYKNIDYKKVITDLKKVFIKANLFI